MAKKPAKRKIVAKTKKKKAPAKRKPAAKKPKKKARPNKPDASVVLGEVTAPSGKLAVFDVGLVGFLPRAALEPALITIDVSKGPHKVTGTRVGKGRFADCWDHVAIELGGGEIATSRKLGEAGVDFARLVCMDHGALDHWHHEDSLDGLADFVFWGRDAAALAKAMRAPATRDGHGWTDLPVAEAEAKAMRAEQLKADNHWLLATDLRPHSHHFHALAAARKSKHGAGTIEVGGAKICLFFTSWGDGVFPVFLDLDHDDHPVRVRVQLATDASNAAMHAVNS